MDTDSKRIEKITGETKRVMAAGCFNVIINGFFGPVVRFAIGWVGGAILNWCVGGWVVASLNMLFDTTRFTRGLLPALFAVVSLFLGYIKIYDHAEVNEKIKEGKND